MQEFKQPPRYLTTPQLYEYTTLRRPAAEHLAELAGARIEVPGTRRVIYDREKLDAYIDDVSKESEAKKQ